MSNLDSGVVADFGDEWDAYTQDGVDPEVLRQAFDQYFHLLPPDTIGKKASGFDMGCGSGRWARFVAPAVGRLHCIDPSEKALAVARAKLAGQDNAVFHCASVDAVPLPAASQDFGYCLGVLHHVPDTPAGIRACARLLKPGAPFLLYLYYDFENRPLAFRLVWKLADGIRRGICRLPFALKRPLTVAIAILIYVPLAWLARVLERLGRNVDNLPLSDYRNKDFYFMRTDALDRFGTRLEKRFSRAAITAMLDEAGFDEIVFSDRAPFWVCRARRRLQAGVDAKRSGDA